MSTRVVDRVDEWDERPFTDGYRSLHEFENEEFSGVVRAGGAELFMTKGSVVGIRHGSIEDFEDSGTAYESPSPALPLLAIMQETNDEVRAEYYSEKTAMSEVDSTLSDGGFTGYIELADNVLSGDYYLVYHGGRSMSVGFVGSSSRLMDGDEAFDTANDEVGIYQVRPADVDVIEIPEGESSSGGAGAVTDSETADESPEEDAAEEATAEESADDEPAEANDETDTEESAGDDSEKTTTAVEDDNETAADDEDGGADERADTTTETPDTDADADETVTSTTSTGSGSADDSANGARRSTADTRSESPEAPDRGPTGSDGATTEQQTAAAEQQTAAAERHGTQSASSASSSARENGGQSAGMGTDRQPTGTSQPELALETRAIPSLDPERTSDPNKNGGSARADTFGRTAEQRSPEPTQQTATQANTTQQTAGGQPAQPESNQSQSAETTGTASAQERAPQATAQSESQESGPSVDPGQLEELRTKVDERNKEIDRLESELDRKTTEYEDAKSQLGAVREERDELKTEIERLESELDHLETQFGAATDAERRMTPAEALAGTDIFPRYKSKGDATLKKAHGGSNRREDVLDNLQLEQNTQFDTETVSVGGQTYEEFLESTLEYRFVNWIVGNLLFEIRETGHEKALKDLYDALPVIDWADLKGTVDVVYTEDGQETQSQESFDIVLRNRMGEPLIVANLNDSREGATESMMENLVRSAERVGQTSDAFAGAFLVTRSFFEPPALETADDATKGGLLSRDKRKSFVNLSRKQGYHLCLVEARNENFTLLVPEL